MHKRLFLLLAVVLSCTLNLAAQDGKKTGWQLELKTAALDLTSTQVKHSDTYQAFPDAKLNADSQTLIRGRLHLTGDYFGQHYLWANSVFMEYGKTTVKPENGEKVTTENADKILVSSDYTLRLWSVQDFLGGFEAGPFVSVAYETEFNATGNNRIKKVLRGSAGAKLFEGKYLKSLFAAGFMEYDFTYPEHAVNYGYEAGLNLEYLVREGVTAKFMALFRDYCYTTKKLYTDLDYSLELDARMDVLVLKNLAVAPFINYYTAQGKYVGPRGENLYIGVSFSFSHTFIAAK